MTAQRLLHSAADTEPGVQRGGRVLEDHLQVAALAAQRLADERGEVHIAKTHVAARGVDETEDQPGDGRLSTAGLPNESERLARLNDEGDAVDGAHRLGRAAAHAVRPLPAPEWKVPTSPSTASSGILDLGGMAGDFVIGAATRGPGRSRRQTSSTRGQRSA